MGEKFEYLLLVFTWSSETLCFVSQFFASDERIKTVRKMIMAVTPEQRKEALDLLLPYQRSDFEGIFRAMEGIIVFGN